MFAPRQISALPVGTDCDGIKVYAISATGAPVLVSDFAPHLEVMKKLDSVPWSAIPAFAILHSGVNLPYLVLCRWGNDNELFVRVAVREPDGWVEDPAKHSFCLWDMEVMWRERASYIKWMYSGSVQLAAYRNDIIDT